MRKVPLGIVLLLVFVCHDSTSWAMPMQGFAAIPDDIVSPVDAGARAVHLPR